MPDNLHSTAACHADVLSAVFDVFFNATDVTVRLDHRSPIPITVVDVTTNTTCVAGVVSGPALLAWPGLSASLWFSCHLFCLSFRCPPMRRGRYHNVSSAVTFGLGAVEVVVL